MKLNYSPLATLIMAVTLCTTAMNATEWGRVVELSHFRQQDETELQTYNRIIAENDYVVVDFYLSYCGPCKALAPEFDALAKQYKNILFIKIDAQMYDALSNQLNIRSAPTLIVYKKGQQIARWTGGDKQRLRSEVARLV